MKKAPLLLTALLIAGLAHADEAAPNADKRALNLAVQRDGQHNQSAAAAVSLPVGDSAWVQAGVGESRSRDAASGVVYRPRQVSLGGGVAGKRWQASLNASQRRDGSALRQNDVAAAVDWKPTDGVMVGVDAATRNARTRGTLAANGVGAATPVEQRIKGHGVGVHGAVDLTQRLSVYGATMHNRYTTTTTQETNGGGLLAGVPLLHKGVSAINRDEAALDRSSQVGATWRVSDRVALNGELQQDRLHDGGSLRSVQMKAAVGVGAGWTLAPGIGHSRGPQGESTNYGLLGASYNW
ncbi:hypothetical protein [Roseateles saccharophilus]|uniref:Uncharacterized protein n=1 Tax=Roseateles saccharophilus TaxID=304 RepID=A0A4R3VKB8_ROSSA|nr:hypothetical protein [Roseateles saccharophilus]MDG0831139.1 hypothetical protein [Roseateles saccharophilus]TCV04259.1 hypothetical protein EV671_100114 [Roseateles saccharophilus]